MRGLDQIARNMFQRRVNRQNRERRIDVRKRQHHGKRTVEKKIERMLGQVHILQQRVEHAIGTENRLPRIRPHQIANPQRNNHHLIQQIFSFAGVERQKIRQRISQQQRKQHHSRRNPHRAQQRLPVHRFLE